MPIPGIDILLGRKISDKEVEDNNLFLLIGSRGVGKTTYCKSFLTNALDNNKKVIYISSNIMFKQFKNFFPNINSNLILSNSLFINPFLKNDINKSNIQNNLNIDDRLFLTLKEVECTCQEVIDKSISETHDKQTQIFGFKNSSTDQQEMIFCDNQNNEVSSKNIIVVLDSISHLFTLFEEKDVFRFINLLSLFLKKLGCKSIFTVNNLTLDQNIVEKISTLFDSTLEMKMEETDKTVVVNRMIRITSFTGKKIASRWINIQMDKTGKLDFLNSSNLFSSLICSVCKSPISKNPVFYQDMAFHKNHLDVYVKLHGIYGDTGITNIGQSAVLTANFFFIDIVGLSNPYLSVRKQIQKIELLNNLIASCPAFRKNSEKMVLPTGDGMAIGFILNPETPLELGMQIHEKLRNHNKDSLTYDSKLEIRIGLASGSVFIVNDINNNQNIWGPGIIFARRVMDVGDGWHILVEGNLAENLLTLDDKYESCLHYLGQFPIKHGQVIKLYSAYDDLNFGNSRPPSKFKE